jgi:hypothetical protein
MSQDVHLSEELARRLEVAAARLGVSPDELAAEVLDAHVPGRRPRFIGIGHSGGGESVAERHREIIREHYADKTASDV